MPWVSSPTDPVHHERKSPNTWAVRLDASSTLLFMDKEIFQVYVKCGFSYLKEIRYYVKESGIFPQKKWSNIFTDRWSTRVRTKSCLLMQSQDACYNDIITFPPIKITLSFSLKVRWQNGSRFNFIIPMDKESIPTCKLLGFPTSIIIQPCLIEQAASENTFLIFTSYRAGNGQGRASTWAMFMRYAESILFS